MQSFNLSNIFISVRFFSEDDKTPLQRNFWVET